MVKIPNFKPFPILPGSFHIYNKPYIPSDVSPIVRSTDLEASRAAHATSRSGRPTTDHSGVLSGAPHRGGHQAEGGFVSQCTVYTVHCAMYSTHCTSSHYTLYTLQYTVHTVLHSLHTIHCTIAKYRRMSVKEKMATRLTTATGNKTNSSNHMARLSPTDCTD